jgi:4-amino-4-deoxy-L-arabinose transferase-like glycosyltransferase
MLKEVFHRFFQKGRVWKILFLLLLSALIAVRFLWLNEFPPGINHDETDVTLSSKSIWKTGRDISGVPFPKFFFSTQTDAGLAMFPSFIFSPIYGLTKLSAWGDRLPYVVVNIITVFAISYLAYLLTRKKSVFWLALFVSLTKLVVEYYILYPFSWHHFSLIRVLRLQSQFL